MNYLRIYTNLIEKARTRSLCGYSERHHILPKSMGGGNEAGNIVRLTAREHFFAHLLLYKIHKNRQMHSALWYMSNGKNKKRYNVTSRQYAIIRAERSIVLSQTLVGSGNPFWGRVHSNETKQKLRLLNLGKKHSEESLIKLKASRVGRKPNIGKTFSCEWRKKIGESTAITLAKNGVYKRQSIEFRGGGNPNAKTTEAEAKEIKQLLANYSTRQVQRITGKSRNIINKIKHGHTWACLAA